MPYGDERARREKTGQRGEDTTTQAGVCRFFGLEPAQEYSQPYGNKDFGYARSCGPVLAD